MPLLSHSHPWTSRLQQQPPTAIAFTSSKAGTGVARGAQPTSRLEVRYRQEEGLLPMLTASCVVIMNIMLHKPVALRPDREGGDNSRSCRQSNTTRFRLHKAPQVSATRSLGP